MGKHVTLYLSDEYLTKLETIKNYLKQRFDESGIVEDLKVRGIDVSKYNLDTINDVIRLLVDIVFSYITNPQLVVIDYPLNDPKNNELHVVTVVRKSTVEKLGYAIRLNILSILPIKVGFSGLAVYGLDDDLWSRLMEILEEVDKRAREKEEVIEIDRLELDGVENADLATTSAGIEVRCAKCGEVVAFITYGVVGARKKITIDETCRKCGTRVRAVVKLPEF